MKNSKRIILISILTLMILPLFLIPRTAVAQEWIYDGVDTERIPNFSVYPTEWYVGNITHIGYPAYFPDENYTIFEIVKGNISDTYLGMPPLPNGTVVYGNIWMVNATSGEKELGPNVIPEMPLCWYNASFGYASFFTSIIPIDDSGKVSAQILQNVSNWVGGVHLEDYPFQNNATYPNIYSIRYWNSTDYFMVNFTDDGIFKKLEHTLLTLQMPNVTLMSQPAQLPPDFSFTTETESLTVNSTDFKLNITITDADNNNDGEIDTDYLYRIQNGTEWSDWATIPDLLDWDLGDVEEGSYDITVEVKNMYGVAQEEITIEFTLPEEPGDGDGIIPSYPIALISIIVLFSISIIIHKYRKKLRL